MIELGHSLIALGLILVGVLIGFVLTMVWACVLIAKEEKAKGEREDEHSGNKTDKQRYSKAEIKDNPHRE